MLITLNFIEKCPIYNGFKNYHHENEVFGILSFLQKSVNAISIL